MLRITRTAGHDAITLKLEGKLLTPWSDELRNACNGTARTGKVIRLDLAAVTYVDAGGAALLAGLLKGGVELAACSS